MFFLRSILCKKPEDAPGRYFIRNLSKRCPSSLFVIVISFIVSLFPSDKLQEKAVRQYLCHKMRKFDCFSIYRNLLILLIILPCFFNHFLRVRHNKFLISWQMLLCQCTIKNSVFTAPGHTAVTRSCLSLFSARKALT